MISTVASPVPTTPPLPPVREPNPLQGAFASIAERLGNSDATLTQMVTDRSTVGPGWAPHLSGIAKELQAARDTLLATQPGDAAVLGAKLGADVLALAEAAGSLGVMARQRATLNEGWSTFLDTATANAVAAAAAVVDEGSAPDPVTSPNPSDPAQQPVPPAPPTPPVTPPAPAPAPTPSAPALPPAVAASVREAIELIGQSIGTIQTVPVSDTGDASTKDARIAAFNLNMQAQKELEAHFGSTDQALVSDLRSADARLEDANWQLAKKPSPDGRFTGVDIPGALRDSQAAADLLAQLVGAPITRPVTAIEQATAQLGRDVAFGGVQVVDPAKYATILTADDEVQLVPRDLMDAALAG